MINSFNHVAITVRDFNRSINWYTKYFGFSVARTIERPEQGIKIAFLALGGQEILEIFGYIDPSKVVEGPTLTDEETGIKHISFFVDDLEAMCQRLKATGVKFTAFTSNRVVFKDPDGIVLELRG